MLRIKGRGWRSTVPLLCAGVGTLAALLSGSGTAALQSNGDSERGEEFFTRSGCYQCHLYSGHGYSGAPGGASLVPLEMTQDGFIAAIRNPNVPRRMPPYSREHLTDAEAADIYAFIRTFPESRDANDIPLLKEILDEN